MTAREFKNLTHEQLQTWLNEQIENARQYRIENTKPPMTSLEESSLRERLYRAACR